MTLSERIAQITLIVAILGVCYFIFAYAQGSISIGNTIVNTESSLNQGLVAYYTFDGPDMVDKVTDRGSSGNDGRLDLGSSGSLSTTTVAGKVGQALAFDGEDDEVFLDDNWHNYFAEDFSVAGWFKLNYFGEQSNRSIWGTYNGGGGTVVRCSSVAHASGVICNAGDQNDQTLWIEDVEPNRWNHLVFTRNNNGTVEFYVNGELATSSADRQVGTIDLSGKDKFRIGHGAYNGHLLGNVDDFRIYNRVLASDEIKQLYNLGEGSKMGVTATEEDDNLVLHYTFDGPDMINNVTDISGEGNHGGLDLGSTGNTATTVTPGVIGQALTFDGEDDEVFISDNWRTHFAEDFSVAGWFRIEDGLEDTGFKLFSTYDGYGDNQVTCTVNLHSFYLACFADEGVSSGGVDTGVWHHFIFSRDNAGSFELYFDGELVDTNTGAGGTFSLNFNDVLRISPPNSSDETVKGDMDDFRIYNKVLSAHEVARLYEQGGGSTITPCGAFTVTDVDGNTYDTVQIGGQCWMAENMRVGTRVGISTTQTDNGIIEKWCYNDTDSNCTTDHPNYPDGGLYQWNEAMQYNTTEGAQGICPDGWHIPTDDEYKTLEMHLGMSQAEADGTDWRGTDEGTKLKPNGSSGFEGNLAGLGLSSSFDRRGSNGYFWSSSESGSDAWYRDIYSSVSRVNRSAKSQTDGLSVRCLRDS